MTSKDSMNWIEDLDWLDKNLGHWIHMYTSGLSTARIKRDAGRAIKEHLKIAEFKARQDEVHKFLNRPDGLGEEKYATRRIQELESQLKELSDV